MTRACRPISGCSSSEAFSRITRPLASRSARIQKLTGVTRSHGCSFADSWQNVQFQRMPNVSLLPGEQDLSLADIIAATDRGIVIKHDGSWSIDHQRYNFQFSGQAFYEVRGGKVVGMLRDVAYQSRHALLLERDGHDWRHVRPTGWGAPSTTARASRSQINSVSHGCVPARFRNVRILNTARTS